MYIPPIYIHTHTHRSLTHAICLDAPENITGVRSTTMNVKKNFRNNRSILCTCNLCVYHKSDRKLWIFFLSLLYSFRVIYGIIIITFDCDHSSSRIIIIIITIYPLYYTYPRIHYIPTTIIIIITIIVTTYYIYIQ